MTRSLHTLIQYLRHSIPQHGDAALTDAQLLERWVGQHDPAAFELMLWRHGPMVLSTCRRLLSRREDIEDAFQATFLVLVRKAGSIRRREALAAWLHRVACRIAARARLTNRLRSSREQPCADTLAAPHVDAPAARDLHAILDEEIESLPAHYRRALILCCLEGKSQEEAARLLDRPRGTVSSWLTRGRERLRQRLLRRGIVVSAAGLSATLTPDALASGGMIPLIGSLVRMAGTVVAGGVPTGLMSARTISLAEGVLRMMFMAKVKIAAVISLVLVMTATGVGTWFHTLRAADDPIILSGEPHKETPIVVKPARKEETPIVVKHAHKETPIAVKGNSEDGIAWGEKAHGLQAGIAFRRGDQETYEIGQSVTFVVYLRNVSDTKINLSHIEPLFDEWMPIVADAEGRRLAVAHGPINLGVVPMTHRSVEAGQRITLGYPWFRIRPLGWRGEVLGPTCCAEPGRYNVGFTGLPLRLSDGKDISLGTKQVELNIRKSEIAKEGRALGKAPTEQKPVLPRIGNPEGSQLYFSTRILQIPFRLSGNEQEKIRGVILLVSRDEGRTWEQMDKKPSNEHCFRFHVPNDGVYWFIVQTVDNQGRPKPANPERVKPDMRVCVDTTAPVVQLFRPVVVNQNTVHLGWTAKDANLEENPITLEWTEDKDGPWHRIGGGANSGSDRWHLPKGMPSKVYLRIRVRDKAGNEASAATNKPISLVPEQSVKPEALLPEEEAFPLSSEKQREEAAFRIADRYLNDSQFEKALQKYEEIAKMWDQKPASLRAWGGAIRCFGMMGDMAKCKQQVKVARDRLDRIEELTDKERQQWLKWLDAVENAGVRNKTEK